MRIVPVLIGLPGRSYRGALPPLTSDQRVLRDRLIGHVEMLAGVIGERNIYRSGSLERAARYIEEHFAANGYTPTSQEYDVTGVMVRNIESALGDVVHDTLLIGAHYDSVSGCPGANDNASGVAALLELPRLLTGHTAARAIRFVAFVNEEPPFFMPT